MLHAIVTRVRNLQEKVVIQLLTRCPRCKSILISVSSSKLYVLVHDVRYWKCLSCEDIYSSELGAKILKRLGASARYLKEDEDTSTRETRH